VLAQMPRLWVLPLPCAPSSTRPQDSEMAAWVAFGTNKNGESKKSEDKVCPTEIKNMVYDTRRD